MPIEADPGLTVQVLQFVNSSYFGFRNEISNVKQAIAAVGVRTIKTFVLSCAVFRMIANPRCEEFELKCLWQGSLRRGLFARTMGKVLGLREAEEPFTAALLQDMAVPILAKSAPELYNKLLKFRADNFRHVRLSVLENHVFGWTHADVAEVMAGQWHLPEDLADLIRDQGEQSSGLLDQEPGKQAVSLSALLPATADARWGERDTFAATPASARPTVRRLRSCSPRLTRSTASSHQLSGSMHRRSRWSTASARRSQSGRSGPSSYPPATLGRQPHLCLVPWNFSRSISGHGVGVRRLAVSAHLSPPTTRICDGAEDGRCSQRV
jgi:HD-like signal output (HDOD) protein